MNITINQVLSDFEMEDCFKIRKKVFIEGQNVPKDIEVDGLDVESQHYIVKLDQESIGTARVRYIKDKAKIERVAIIPEYQGMGCGKKLMRL